MRRPSRRGGGAPSTLQHQMRIQREGRAISDQSLQEASLPPPRPSSVLALLSLLVPPLVRCSAS